MIHCSTFVEQKMQCLLLKKCCRKRVSFVWRNKDGEDWHGLQTTNLKNLGQTFQDKQIATTKEILFRRFLCARGWKIHSWSAGGPSGLSVQMQVRCKWRLFVLHVWAFMWGVLRLHVCWRTGTHHGAGGDFCQRMQVPQVLLPEKTVCGQLYRVSGVSRYFLSPFSFALVE